jgi:anti-sigma regulatory factor (Ser/Thr protein kinase)
MSPLLVVGNSEQEATNLQRILKQAGFESLSVTGGFAAAVQSDKNPSLILCDCSTQHHDTGLGVESLQRQFPEVPILVLTDSRNDLPTKKAIEAGVDGCLTRDRVESGMKQTVLTILDPVRAKNLDGESQVRDAGSVCYTIDNNPELLPLIVNEIRRRISEWPFRDPIELVRVTVALSESLDNALYHGNLELSSDLRQGDGREWREESLRRRQIVPYCERRIHVQGCIDHKAARFTISDEGPGFDLHGQRDCTDASNLERCSGRGLLLMRMYMDEVSFNSTGNSVTLVKYRP